ncbi:MAG TPA: metallophosphoesterase, partial [Polyangiaceae bacterium]|nr:metallophosphoesterase [Polyangiaceae bacterium]
MRRFIALTLTLGFLVSGCGTSTEADSPPTTPNGTASCGDSVCDESESCETCPEDCGDCEDGPNFCGDFVCDDEEDCVSCPEDCGDCFSEITCGDDICSETESCSTCPEDCGQCIESHCGDGQCSGIETCDTCPADCGPCKTSCGDGSCQEDENCLSCSADCGSCAPGHLDIWSPRPIAPQFAVAGGAIQAEVNGKDTWNPNEWYAVVRNTYRTWPCKVTAKYGSIDYGRRKGWILDIQLPIYVPPELLELAIAHGEAGTGSRIRSVQMVASFDEDFYIIHQTDHHIAAKNAKRPDGTVDLGGGPKPGTSQALTWGAKAINIINPRFVMLTGDNIFVIFEDKNSWRGLKRSVEILNYFKEGINTYQVATLVTSGNHDVGTNIHTTPDQLKYLEEYANILGPRSFSRRMGPFYIGLFEWSRSQFTEAMTKDYNASFQDPLVQFRLVGSHFN